MKPYLVIDAEQSAISLCDKTAAILGSYIEKGETLVKVVHCAKHYGAALFRSGRLVLLAPESSTQHGTIIENGDNSVRDVAAGDTHIVFCKEDGTVFSFGCDNKYGQLGDGTVWRSVPYELCNHETDKLNDDGNGLPKLSLPRMIGGFGYGKNGSEEGKICEGKLLCVPVISVACGANHTLLLTSLRNCVYACGLGSSGQLGGKRRPLLQPLFKSIRLLFGMPIRQIVAAGNHSFVLLQTGKLFAFGDNTCGQLGLGSIETVSTPRAVTFSGVSNGQNKQILDPSVLKSLRATWGSAESMFFPLRVERLSPELDPAEPFILSVWCCSTRSVVLTKALNWLSCGLPLSRSPCDFNKPSPKMDRYGPLGRWIQRKEEAFLFQKMRWSERVSATLSKSFPSVSDNEASLDDVLAKVTLVCSSRAVTLLIRERGEAQKASVFVQGEVPCAVWCDHEGQSPLAPAARADRLLQDNEVDNGSLEYALPGVQTIIASDVFEIVM